MVLEDNRLKVKPIGFAMRLNAQREREKGLKDGTQVSAFTETGSKILTRGSVCLQTLLGKGTCPINFCLWRLQ